MAGGQLVQARRGLIVPTGKGAQTKGSICNGSGGAAGEKQVGGNELKEVE